IRRRPRSSAAIVIRIPVQSRPARLMFTIHRRSLASAGWRITIFTSAGTMGVTIEGWAPLIHMMKAFSQFSRSAALCIANVVLAVLLCPVSAWAWGPDGHEIVAVIAADNLTPAAASHVADIFGVSADKRSIATAMEAASIRPDFEFRDEDHSTKLWHFIDICLQDRRADVQARCPGGNCVTGKIDEYSKRLKESNYDHWGAAGDLAFLIHFVGDIHQPLHAANDEDYGGNCITVDSNLRASNLHDVWDTTVVRRLEYSVDSGRPETTAHKLERAYAAE